MNERVKPTLLFSCDFDEQTAYEVEMKGWFEAVAARLPDGLEVPLSFRDPVRLSQDLELEVAAGKFCVAEPGLVVVPKVTKANMEQAVLQLYEEGYFDRLGAISLKRDSSRDK
jgi:hypothetical protein